MAVLTDFYTAIENFYSLWEDKVNTNQRQAEIKEQTLRKLHSNMDLFFIKGRDGLYNDALDIYETLLTLLNIPSSNDAWDVDASDLETFFGVSGGGTTTSEFQTAVFANPLNLDTTTYKDWICASITADTTINVNNSENGDSGMVKFTMDTTGGYTIVLGAMFTERLGSTGLDVTANAINYVSWRNVGGNLTYTVDIATAV